ncbi:MAG: nucleotide-binding protein [Deltaproteobacteria bacterium]|nr:nucleotide-binding protein [Deltaproteobacteria bacterium]
MEKTKKYEWIKFTPEVITKALKELKKHIPSEKLEEASTYFSLRRGVEEWKYDHEAEFFAGYRSNFDRVSCWYNFSSYSLKFTVYSWIDDFFSEVIVSLPDRAGIESVFSIVEDAVSSCRIPKPPPVSEPPWKTKVKIFIGHGRNQLWRDLKDHLSDKHGFKVEAYEMGVREGLTVKDILDEMLTQSSFALLVLTGETEDVNGVVHARDNVIHEVGLFQGRLGFRKAIVLLEEDVSEFSNIVGIHQIRFSKGSIRETFGDVLATIEREFCAE